MIDPRATGAALRSQIDAHSTDDIVTLVHSRLATRDERDRFEAARFGLSHSELADLAARTLESLGR